MRKHYPHDRACDIAEKLGRTEPAVYGRANNLGLTKSDKFNASPASGRLRGERGQQSRFKPGHASWNKGKRITASGRSPETQFKKGAKPHNWKPVGSYRITNDGLLQQKISDDPGPNNVRWRSVHELVWIEVRGPIPDGHLIRFKPGMHTTTAEKITIDRLDCISRAENMRRNSLHNYGPEIAGLIQLRGAVTRQINKRERHDQKQN